MKRVWTSDRNLRFKKNISKGMIYENIGIEMGIPRNSIAKRVHDIKERPPIYTPTYGESKLAGNVQDQLCDLLLAVKRCKNAGLGVKIDIALNQSSLIVWKDLDGEISFFDKDTMGIILRGTIP